MSCLEAEKTQFLTQQAKLISAYDVLKPLYDNLPATEQAVQEKLASLQQAKDRVKKQACSLEVKLKKKMRLDYKAAAYSLIFMQAVPFYIMGVMLGHSVAVDVLRLPRQSSAARIVGHMVGFIVMGWLVLHLGAGLMLPTFAASAMVKTRYGLFIPWGQFLEQRLLERGCGGCRRKSAGKGWLSRLADQFRLDELGMLAKQFWVQQTLGCLGHVMITASDPSMLGIWVPVSRYTTASVVAGASSALMGRAMDEEFKASPAGRAVSMGVFLLGSSAHDRLVPSLYGCSAAATTQQEALCRFGLYRCPSDKLTLHFLLREKMLQVHPDKVGEDLASTSAAADLSAAFRVLKKSCFS